MNAADEPFHPTVPELDEEPVRVAPRDSLLLQGRLTLVGGSSPATVRVRNLSSGGCLVESDIVAVSGQAAMIELRGIGSVAGKVAWVGKGRFGIAFARLIDPVEARTRPSTDANASIPIPAPRKPGPRRPLFPA